MTKSLHCKYLILGGGITGLSFANFAKNEDWLLCEAQNSVGGYCKSIHQDGFTWDYSGHFFHFKTDFVRNLFLSKMEDVEIYDIKKKSGILYKNKRIDFPFQKNIHQLDKAEFIDCLCDLFKRDPRPPKSFLEMLYGKFGESITEKFLKPYNEKLYACDLDQLDVDAMGRFFPHASVEEIIANFKAPDATSYNSSFIYPKKGAYEFVKALLHDLPPSQIKLEHRATSVDCGQKVAHFDNGTSISYDFLISSIPFTKFMQLAGVEYDSSLYSASNVLVFNMGFDRPSTFEDHWLYVPDKAVSFYRVGFYDNIFSSERMSLYVEIACREGEPINEKERLKKTLYDLKHSGIIRDHKLLTYSAILMAPAYVHIRRESMADFADKCTLLASSDVYSIGRYGGWKYCSIEDNVVEAHQTYEKIKEND